MARMMVGSRKYVMGRYKLHKIKEIEDLVADAVQIVSECLLKQSACRETFASWQLHPGPNCGCSELGPFSAANGQKPDRPPSCSAVHSLVRLVSHAGTLAELPNATNNVTIDLALRSDWFLPQLQSQPYGTGRQAKCLHDLQVPSLDSRS